MAPSAPGGRWGEGKQQSRRNALQHGLIAETIIDGLEDSEDHRALEAAVIAEYDARTTLQRELVLRLASFLWRLRRIILIETDSSRFNRPASGSAAPSLANPAHKAPGVREAIEASGVTLRYLPSTLKSLGFGYENISLSADGTITPPSLTQRLWGDGEVRFNGRDFVLSSIQELSKVLRSGGLATISE
jgi:hypothetical protein